MQGEIYPHVDNHPPHIPQISSLRLEVYTKYQTSQLQSEQLGFNISPSPISVYHTIQPCGYNRWFSPTSIRPILKIVIWIQRGRRWHAWMMIRTMNPMTPPPASSPNIFIMAQTQPAKLILTSVACNRVIRFQSCRANYDGPQLTGKMVTAAIF